MLKTGVATRTGAVRIQMKIQAERAQGHNAVSAYGAGFVTINGETYRRSLVVGHDRLEPGSRWADVAALHSGDLLALARNCDVILLGTGRQQRFPPRSVLLPLLKQRLGVEVMDTAAACRTYNVLLAEGRAVVAALIIE